MPLISIITPAYNAAKYIGETILSVQSQTYRDWELLIIDDGSKDETAEVVRAAQARDSRIVYYFQENKRLGAARNAGFRMAQGEYIAFLDSDDLWFPEMLEAQLQAIKEKRGDVIFTDGYILYEDTGALAPYGSVTGFFPGDVMYRMQMERNFIPVLSVMLPKSIVREIGDQGESIDIFGCEDWDYWLRIARNGYNFYGVAARLFKYRIHAGGMSRKVHIMVHAEFTAVAVNVDYALIEKYSVAKRLASIVDQNVPRLLKYGLVRQALYELKTLLSIDFNFLRFLTYNSLRMGLTSPRFVSFLLHPLRFFNSVKKRVLSILLLRSSRKRIRRFIIKQFAKIFSDVLAEHQTHVLQKVRTYEGISIHESFHAELLSEFYINGPVKRIMIKENVACRKFCNFLVFPGGSLTIEKNVFFNNYCSVNCLGEILIGENTIFGESVKLYDHNHSYNLGGGTVTVEREGFNIGTITIGKNCWIGSNVTILMNVHIGDNVIIGANNLVYKSVPANSIIKARSEFVAHTCN